MTNIITKRLTLTPHQHPKTVKDMVRWLNDPDVVQYSEQRHKRHFEYEQHKYITSWPFHRQGDFREIHAGDAFIGTITAHVDENNSVANVGILIGEKKEWGKGYGTEAWQAFCDYLLGHGIRKIEAGAMDCNTGMIRIFRKTKMYQEGRLSGHFLLNGKEVDMFQWARFI